ncbi:MAG: hormogonium polysaccharide biosynthesis glycosyltransferase HpsE [Tolypothrix carrinoi HA7290-LM1]|jgi:glycosyltransferase involved in cell wall biosynthesis|nr:hormogonium polysaccharide biosynthesis glycosyltransferase HpsE [Tolypothrix carrinoi HA7290-LM1]
MSVDFTVAIPTYNGENRLPRVLERLQECFIYTTRSHNKVEDLCWEIIIVDNNSTDGTAKLIQEYQANWHHHVPLRYYFEPEQGLAFARQRAVKEAKGEFVGFLDDDNLPKPNWVSEAYKFGKQHPGSGAYASQIHGLFEVEPSEHLKQIIFYLAITERGYEPLLYEPRKKGFPPGAGLVVRRQVWNNYVPNRLFLVGRVGSSMLAGEDAEALLYIHRAGWEIWYNPAMEIEHIIPSWRLERSYLISLMRGIGLSRYHLRMLLLESWQRPFAFFIYLPNDLRKFTLYFLRHHTVIDSDVVAACEMERLLTTFMSPFYLGKIQIKRFLRI